MPGDSAFVDELRAVIDAGRAFGRHPLWLRIEEGRLPRSAFGPFAVQFFLQVRDFPRALERHYGCTRAQVGFWDVHEQADREHSAIGDHVVVRLATTPELQADVRRAVARSLELWWRFFDGIAATIDAG